MTGFAFISSILEFSRVRTISNAYFRSKFKIKSLFVYSFYLLSQNKKKPNLQIFFIDILVEPFHWVVLEIYHRPANNNPGYNKVLTGIST